jgi:hypothetical protein
MTETQYAAMCQVPRRQLARIQQCGLPLFALNVVDVRAIEQLGKPGGDVAFFAALNRNLSAGVI